MGVTARQLLEEDAELAVRIASVVAAGSVAAEHTGSFLSDASNILIAGFVDNEPVGFVSAHLLGRFKDYRRKMFIYEVDVLPAFQRLGVGGAMLKELFSVAISQRADTAFVLTNRANSAAVGLYSAMGGTDAHDDDVLFEFTI